MDVVGIECDVSGKAHGQAGGQFAVLLDIFQEGRHVAGTPLGGGVQGDAHQLMVDERLDAKQAISIQIHPDDEYALENENEYGKN